MTDVVMRLTTGPENEIFKECGRRSISRRVVCALCTSRHLMRPDLVGVGMLIVITFYRRRDWGTGSLSPGGIPSALPTHLEDFFPVTSIWLQSVVVPFHVALMWMFGSWIN